MTQDILTLGKQLQGQASQAEAQRTSVSVQTADSSKDGADKLQSETETGNVVDAGNVGEEATDREAEVKLDTYSRYNSSSLLLFTRQSL